MPWRLAAVDCLPVGHNKTDKRGSVDTDQYPKIESLLPKSRATLVGMELRQMIRKLVEDSA